jgi:hypothetical protein
MFGRPTQNESVIADFINRKTYYSDPPSARPRYRSPIREKLAMEEKIILFFQLVVARVCIFKHKFFH